MIDLSAHVVRRYLTAFYGAVLLLHGETVNPMHNDEKLVASAGILIGFCIIGIIFVS